VSDRGFPTNQDKIFYFTSDGDKLSIEITGLNNPGVVASSKRDDVVTLTSPEDQTVQPPAYGPFPYELVVTDNEGNTDLDVAVVTVIVGQKPVPVPQAFPTTGPAPLTVSFIANAYDPDGTIRRLRWDYNNDGTFDYNTQTMQGSQYTYLTPGTYEAVLEVEDAALGGANSDPVGNVSRASITITVTDPEEFQVKAIADPSTGSDPLTVNLTAEINNNTSRLTLFEWDLDGDGSYEYSSTESPTLTRTFSPPGNYRVNLRVTDAAGTKAVSSTQIDVRQSGNPEVTALAEPSEGPSALSVLLDGLTEDYDGNIVLYEWDFEGDGVYDYSSAISPKTSNIYIDTGTYNALLRVTDDSGKQSVSSVQITVIQGIQAVWSVEGFDPFLGQNAVISTSVVSPITMSLKIYDQAYNLIRQLATDEFRMPGVYQDTWNGQNESGVVEVPGVYLFVIEYRTASGVEGTFDLTDTGALSYSTPSASYPNTFNPLLNEFLYGSFTLQNSSQITSYVPPFPSGALFPIRTLFTREPFRSGPVVITWDGTDDQGHIVDPGPYVVAILAWKIPDNGVILDSKPKITDWRVDPVFLSPGSNPYDPIPGDNVSEVFFTLSKQANLEINIYDNDDNFIVQKTINNQPGGSVSFSWDGRSESGDFVAPGFYHAEIVATADGISSTPVNTIFKVTY
jgi:PKD repeat protein